MRHATGRLRAFLSLLLCCALTFCVLVPAAGAATRENVRQYDTYMCIGDSIAAGYTVSGTQGNYLLTRVPGAYHDIVATATGAKLNQFGWSAFRSVELRYMLEGERHDLDDTWLQVYSVLIGDDVLNQYRDAYLQAIRESDLITLNLGSNDVLSYSFAKAMMQLSGDSEVGSTVKDILARFPGNIGAAMVKLMETMQKLGKLPQLMTALMTTLPKAFLQFTQNFNACLKDIYAMNPDATIVVVGVYNPYNSLTLSADSALNLGPVVQPFVDQLNLFLHYQCPYAAKYLFAPVDGTETWPFNLQQEDFLSYHTWAVHPTAKGHAYMADQILSVLPEREAEPAPAKLPFTDVADTAWYAADVRYVWEQGLMQGVTATTFSPDTSTTRAQFATVLYRMAGSPAVSDADMKSCPFTDLKADWYRSAVVWAWRQGVVNGTSATTFTPDQNVTREQLVAMLWRYDGSKTAADSLRFSDAGTISAYARPAVAWAVETGVVGGMPDGTFQPKGTATRAQLAAILHRYLTA